MIQYDDHKKIWVLETAQTSYALGVSDSGTINHIYYGEKLPKLSDYPDAKNEQEWASFTSGEGMSREEFMGWCKPKYTEPCIKATFQDGVRDVVLTYVDHTIEENALTIHLKDVYYALHFKLLYRVIPECDIFERTVEVINVSDYPIVLESILTGSLHLPREKEYRLTFLSGKWVGESQIQEVMVPKTKMVLESRRGATSHETNPVIFLDANALATEDVGDVYTAALAFSGNWKMVVEKNAIDTIKISAGINDFDFSWHLKPRELFKTPAMVLSYTNKGFGHASRNLHQYQMKYVLPNEHNNDLRKVLYNSWEATFFDVNEEGQSDLAERAAAIGVELFVMDDGWFGERSSDLAGLGDWTVNTKKFPNGLEGLINKVNALGMDFGLWVEPEMVNPDSNLYRQHPEWAYHFETRKPTEARNQLVLNLAREDVRQYLFEVLDQLLSENNITFIKWDLNRSISEPGYPSAPLEEQREIWVRHARGVYELVNRLKENHPDVIFQSCSGGGGRCDFGILQYFDQVWVSDNTDAFDRLMIQEGFSMAYCPKIMESWVTEEMNWVNKRKLSLKYRFHVAMMGNLGIGADLTKWTWEEEQEATQLISLYKEIRETIQHGQHYRLLSPRKGILTAVEYINKDLSEVVIFVFLHSNHFMEPLPRIKAQGLEEDAVYYIQGTQLYLSGKALMKIGIEVMLKGDFDSTLIRLMKQ